MTQWWQRKSDGWPSRWPWAMTGALILGLMGLAAAGAWQYYNPGSGRTWTGLQKMYLGAYVTSGMRAWAHRGPTSYDLVYRVDGKAARLAVNEDLSDPDVLDGRAKVGWNSGEQGNAELHAWLLKTIYKGRTPWERFVSLWPVGVLVFGFALVRAVPKDRERWRILKHGIRVRGPELLTALQFNERNNSDGIGFYVTEERRFRAPRVVMVLIRRAIEAMHTMIAADSGMGKTVAITHLLKQIRERGENAIVYDPTPRHEFVTRFYDPERGDVILNPLDQRMPYWSPADEVGHEAEALTVATSLFQDDRRDNPFFVEGPRKVFAHLLTLKPTPQQLVSWLSNEEEIDRRVKGTPLASLIYASAPQQRAGILASLSMVASALKLLPKREEANGTWSAKAWAKAKERKGWIFITSRPEDREPLKPLISLWLDLLILRLMNDVAGERPATWFVLDELASLQRLPQLLTAVTENRKSGNPVVLGFQGRAQIEARYGREAEVLFSQPATKVFLRTSEPHSAEWISKAIGEVEMKRRRKSRNADEFPNRRASQGVQDDLRIEPLMMPSEIMGLEQLHGFLKHGNFVVPITLYPIDLPAVHEGFVARPETPEAPEGPKPRPEPVRPAPEPPVLDEGPAYFE